MKERSGPRRRSDSDDSDSTMFVHEDQLVEIQKRLPLKSLCRFKCVSRNWRSLISSPSFIDSHFTHSATRPKLLVSFPAQNPDGRVGVRLCLADQSDPRNDQPQIVTPRLLLPERQGSFCSASVEGLICLEVASGVDICNPSTGKQVTFGLPGTAARFPNMRARHSFGFDPVERKHKVLCVTRTIGRQFTMKSWVLTLGTKEWRVFVLPPCWQEMVKRRRVYAVGTVCSGELLFAPETLSKSVWVFYYDLKTNGFRWSEICGLPDPARRFLFPRRELRFSEHVESLLPLGN